MVRQSPLSFQWKAVLSPHFATASANSVQTGFPETALSMSERSAMTSMSGNTLLAGGARLIYVRSRRSIVTLGAAGLACALAFGALAAVAMVAQVWPAGLALAVGALGGAGLGPWAGWGLALCPSGRPGPFRDRLGGIHGRHETRAGRALVESGTPSQT